MRRIDRLWKELDGPGEPPCADAGDVKGRVNAALDVDPMERRSKMKHKIACALTATALAAALTGSALAVSSSMDALSAYFGGDRAPVEDYMDTTPRSVSDDNYIFTVENSVSAGDRTYFNVTITALNEESKKFLFSDDFSNMWTFSIHPVLDETYTQEEQKHETAMCGAGWGFNRGAEPDENSVSIHVSADLSSKAKSLQVGLDCMEEGKYVEIPVKRAPSVTVKIGATGTGIRDLSQMEDGTLTINSVTLNPLTCSINVSNPSTWDMWVATYPRILFRMTDGSVRTQSQMMDQTAGGSDGKGNIEMNYEFKDVQDVNKIAGIIAFDVEYPMDGSKPFAVEHDDSLNPITVSRMDPLTEKGGNSLPVRELTEKLGGSCEWDAETGDVTCTYRGVSVVVRAGEKTALVDGKPVEQLAAPGVQDGKLCVDYKVIFDAWGLYGFVQREALEDQAPPVVWHDWYIVP